MVPTWSSRRNLQDRPFVPTSLWGLTSYQEKINPSSKRNRLVCQNPPSVYLTSPPFPCGDSTGVVTLVWTISYPTVYGVGLAGVSQSFRSTTHLFRLEVPGVPHTNLTTLYRTCLCRCLCLSPEYYLFPAPLPSEPHYRRPSS